eukprot:SAG11_NODE_160_length_14023_cov_23.003017_10_plen_140_part_00
MEGAGAGVTADQVAAVIADEAAVDAGVFARIGVTWADGAVATFVVAPRRKEGTVEGYRTARAADERPLLCRGELGVGAYVARAEKARRSVDAVVGGLDTRKFFLAAAVVVLAAALRAWPAAKLKVSLAARSTSVRAWRR